MQVEGAHCGREVDALVGHVAAVAPVVFETYLVLGALLYQKVAGLGGIEIKRHCPAVGEEAGVEAHTPCARGLPLQAVVAYVGDDLAETVVVEVFRREISAVGIERYLVVAGYVEARAELEKVEEIDILHPFLRGHQPRCGHRGEEAPRHSAYVGCAGRVLAETRVALEHGVDIEDITLHECIFARQVPRHVAPFEVAALGEVERRRGVAEVVDEVGRRVMAFAVRVDVGVVLVTETAGETETVLDAAQRIVEQVQVGDERGVTVHEALDHVAALGIDFTVFIDEITLVDTIVGHKRVLLDFVERIGHETFHRQRVVEAVARCRIDVEAVVAPLAEPQVEDIHRVGDIKLVLVGVFRCQRTVERQDIGVVERRLDHRDVVRRRIGVHAVVAQLEVVLRVGHVETERRAAPQVDVGIESHIDAVERCLLYRALVLGIAEREHIEGAVVAATYVDTVVHHHAVTRHKVEPVGVVVGVVVLRRCRVVVEESQAVDCLLVVIFVLDDVGSVCAVLRGIHHRYGLGGMAPANACVCLDFGSLGLGALGLDDDNAVAALGAVDGRTVFHHIDVGYVVGRNQRQRVVEMAVHD